MNIKLSDLILRKDNLLSKEECRFLIEEYERISSTSDTVKEHCLDANSGIDTYSTFSRVTPEFGTEAQDLCHQKTEEMINEYLNYLEGFKSFHHELKSVLKFSHMYRILKYSVGEKIHPHTDYAPNIHGSCTFNLNEGYKGGDLCFWNGKHRVSMKEGSACIWPADLFWVHEVLPINSGVRYSMNSFLQAHPTSIMEEINECTNSIIQKGRIAPSQQLSKEVEYVYST
jgi:hypothetical protein